MDSLPQSAMSRLRDREDLFIRSPDFGPRLPGTPFRKKGKIMNPRYCRTLALLTLASALLTGMVLAGCAKEEKPAGQNGGTYYEGPLQKAKKKDTE